MDLSVGEQIKIIMKRKNINMTQLAAATHQTRQNLSNKMSRDNFTEKEMRAIAEALGCEIKIEFSSLDGSIRKQ